MKERKKYVSIWSQILCRKTGKIQTQLGAKVQKREIKRGRLDLCTHKRFLQKLKYYRSTSNQAIK